MTRWLEASGSLETAEIKEVADMTIHVKITPNETGQPSGKLADAELHFADGELDGLRLIGFSIWKRRDGAGRTVTFPARQYTAAGERRTFALLRPIADTDAPTRVRDLVLDAYDKHEAASGSTSRS